MEIFLRGRVQKVQKLTGGVTGVITLPVEWGRKTNELVILRVPAL